jgi:hypothetical protein
VPGAAATLAEYWISATRDQVLSLACSRLGYPAGHAKGVHLLPAELTTPLETTLVQTLGEAELRRALAAAADLLTAELHRSSPRLAAVLQPMLTQLSSR